MLVWDLVVLFVLLSIESLSVAAGRWWRSSDGKRAFIRRGAFSSLEGPLTPLLAVFTLTDTEKRAQYIEEERHMREENIRLQRKLQREMERREALCRQLSESESSLEMDDER